MILRISAKLGKKIRIAPTAAEPLDANPLADWSAHLFTADRTQYVLVSNTSSLYSIACYGKGITDEHQLITRLTTQLREHLEDDGLQFIYERFIMPSTDRVTMSKSLNRSVIGSMNDMIACAKVLLTDHEYAPYDLSEKLNDMPMSYLSFDSPKRAIRQLAPA